MLKMTCMHRMLKMTCMAILLEKKNEGAKPIAESTHTEVVGFMYVCMYVCIYKYVCICMYVLSMYVCIYKYVCKAHTEKW
jgi:hypothetical protein